MSVPGWCDGKQVIKKLPVLPPHETLDVLIPPGQEDEFLSLDEGFWKQELHRWGQRVHTDVASGKWACLGVWGDAAPYTKKR